MVQSVNNYEVIRPIYNGVDIKIRKPEVNAANNQNTYVSDNGIYNGVSIDIDNPVVNTEPKNTRIYSYPEAQEIVTYDIAKPIQIPQYNIAAYHTASIIIPEKNIDNSQQHIDDDIEEIDNIEDITDIEETDDIEEIDTTDDIDDIDDIEEIEIPAPFYTTVEAEKEAEFNEVDEEIDELEDTVPQNDNEEITDTKETVEIQTPEIIPGEEIQPEVDIPLTVENLTNPDYDIQAQQMEEIARISLDNPENAVPYIVTEVFSSLIDITKQDTSNLAAPSNEQVQSRRKIITNFLVSEQARQNGKEVTLPYQITEDEIILANTLSPMEQAERNKEYALYTIAVLTKVYTDEVEKQTGDIVPLTDLPGSSAIVDALRYNENAGVKIAAIESLNHIQRPEYKEEMKTLYTLAQADQNPQVTATATRALAQLQE